MFENLSEKLQRAFKTLRGPLPVKFAITLFAPVTI